MSQRWLRFLETLGSPLRSGSVSSPFDPTMVRRGAWHEFRDFEALFRLYGPPPASPWFPYHCPTLFAAIDRLNIEPRPVQLSELVSSPAPEGAFGWLKPGTMVVLEQSGGVVVQMGARLVVEAGAQLVSTFDHWPMANPADVPWQSYKSPEELDDIAPKPWPPLDVSSTVAIDSRDLIDSMVTMAPAVFERIKQGIRSNAPPVWMCDSRRVKAPEVGPGNFDNRYFIDDSIMPSAEMLESQGIEQVVYFGHQTRDMPGDDLCGIFNDWHGEGIRLMKAALVEPETWAAPITTGPPPRMKFAGRALPKSRLGGFGRRVPVPEESSDYYSSGRSFGGAGG